MRKKMVIVLSVVGVIFVIVSAIIVVKAVNNEKNKQEVFEPEEGPLSEGKDSAVVSELRKLLDMDEDYQNYYGGMYLKNCNLVVYFTDYEAVGTEVKEFIEQTEGVIVREAKYTLVGLKDLQDEINQKYEKYYEDGDKATISFLKDFTGTGIDEENNELVVRIYDINKKKIRKFKKLFGDDPRIQYENGGRLQLDEK